MQEDEYYSFFYQKELTNYPLISKYILHVVTTIFSHVFIFFYLPITGNLNLNSKIYCPSGSDLVCNDVLQNPFLISFYIIYLFYMFFSGLQVRFGLHDIKKKSLFMRKDTILYSVLFKCYKYCPFIYELKLVIDWTFTPTSLDIFKWGKFESVYDNLFMVQCQVRANQKIPPGKKVGNYDKVLWGVSTFIILIAVLLGPILLFSTLNPTNNLNNVFATTVSLLLCFESGPGSYNNFTLFKTDSIEQISGMGKLNFIKNNKFIQIMKNLSNFKPFLKYISIFHLYIILETNVWKDFKYDQFSSTKAFPIEQVQIIQMSQSSDTGWNIAKPHVDFILDRLENVEKHKKKIILAMEYNFLRKVN